MECWPIFDIFKWLRPFLCSKRFHKQATHRRRGDDPFLCLGPLFMTWDGPKMVHFGTKMAKHGRLVNAPKWSKRGSKGNKVVNLSVFDHLKPFWVHLNPFGPWSVHREAKISMASLKNSTDCSICAFSSIFDCATCFTLWPFLLPLLLRISREKISKEQRGKISANI